MSALIILGLILILAGVLCQIPGMRPREVCTAPCCDPEAEALGIVHDEAWITPAMLAEHDDRVTRRAIDAQIEAALLEGYRGPSHGPAGEWPPAYEVGLNEQRPCPCPECTEAFGPWPPKPTAPGPDAD